MSDMVKVCGLWENEKDGKRYFSGSMGGVRFVILPNNFKEKPNQPDFNLFIAQAERRERSGGSGEQPKPAEERSYYPPPPEDDVPF